jgi:hypothetical protein
VEGVVKAPNATTSLHVGASDCLKHWSPGEVTSFTVYRGFGGLCIVSPRCRLSSWLRPWRSRSVIPSPTFSTLLHIELQHHQHGRLAVRKNTHRKREAQLTRVSWYKAITPKTRVAIGFGIMAYAGFGLFLSDKAEEKFGLTPTEKDKEELRNALPKISTVERSNR